MFVAHDEVLLLFRWKSSNTAYITFDDVKVPCTHLIGQESQGFKYVMWNFNHEVSEHSTAAG